MAFIPAPTVAQFNIRYLLQGEQVQNTLYFQRGLGWSIVQLQSMAFNLRTEWGTNVMQFLSAQLSLVEVNAVDLESEVAPSVTVGGVLVPGGAVDADPLPNSVTFCVKFTTAQRGRSGRGRIYLPGIPNNAVTGNEVTLASAEIYADAVSQAVADAIAGFNDGAVHVVLSRYNNGIARQEGVAQGVLGYGWTDNVVDNQRRRLPGRGR